MGKFFSIVKSTGLRRGTTTLAGRGLGGLAAKLNVDVAYVRIRILFFCLLPGPAVVLYLLRGLVLPDQQNSIALQGFLIRRAGNRYLSSRILQHPMDLRRSAGVHSTG